MRGAALDRSQRDDAVVDDDANLWVCGGVAREDYEGCENRSDGEKVRGVRWKCTFVANGARCDTLNVRCFGMWVAGSGPSAARVVKFSAVKTIPLSAIIAIREV